PLISTLFPYTTLFRSYRILSFSLVLLLLLYYFFSFSTTLFPTSFLWKTVSLIGNETICLLSAPKIGKSKKAYFCSHTFAFRRKRSEEHTSELQSLAYL